MQNLINELVANLNGLEKDALVALAAYGARLHKAAAKIWAEVKAAVAKARAWIKAKL